MRKIKILTVFGTRPEVIKLAPFVKAVEADSNCISVTCATTQHKELQNGFLDLFNIQPNYDLNIMIERQDLFDVTESILNRIKPILNKEKPDYTVVQGDTTTAFVAALSSFYCQTPVVHIEAGLRTGNMYGPYPEEANRTFISRIAALHMSPTNQAVKNLAAEGIIKNVHNVGNTVVDAVEWILNHASTTYSEILKKIMQLTVRKVLITVHRRENFGQPLQEICAAIRELSIRYSECVFIWPVHPNPAVKEFVYKNMAGLSNVHLLEPISYGDLIRMLNDCFIVLSDSGGIQEEACILGKDIIILRNETERPEVVESGYGVLVGSSAEKIKHCFSSIINAVQLNTKADTQFVYGKPGVSQKIIEILKGYCYG